MNMMIMTMTFDNISAAKVAGKKAPAVKSAEHG
jgi:hypothetical protein